MATTPLSLPFEAIDDLIFSARAGDIEALKTDITKLGQENSCPPSEIIESAIDTEDESEGGTGACLLHWPAANGNIEILKYLLESLGSSSSVSHDTSATPTATATARAESCLINHRNNSGNTPLHWAALNTHFDCVKGLVDAGADVRVKNDAGHDAAFLAERAEWSKQGDDDVAAAAATASTEGDATAGESESESTRPMSEGMRVVRLLLESDGSNEADMEHDADADGAELEASANGDSET